MSKENGGPAFPIAPIVIGDKVWDDDESEGMSLRDWFAGQALNALIEDVNRLNENEQGDSAEHPRTSIARRAYAIADAMIAERKKP